MISVTKLLGGPSFYGDRLRYAETSGQARQGTSAGSGPVVVWNATKTCNLECVHCYADIAANPPHTVLGISEAAYLSSLDAFREERFAKLTPRREVVEWFSEHGHRGHHTGYLGARWQAGALLPALDPAVDAHALAAKWTELPHECGRRKPEAGA